VVQGSIRWSPDGNKIAFVSSRGDHNFIGVCDIVTQQIKYIDPGVDGDIDPTWSPDGKSIAFIRVPFTKDALIFGPERASLPWSIRVVDLTTGQAKEIWKAQKGVGSNFFAGGLRGGQSPILDF
jgi:Tol biopolymer transport system component